MKPPLRSKHVLSFKPIDLTIRAELTAMFRIDAYICNSGTAEKFGKRNGPQAKLYLEWIQRKLSFAPTSVVHVWLDDLIVGQIELGEYKDDSSIGYVHLYYIIPEMRGLGLADQLDEYAMKYFLEHGYQTVRLSVGKSNKRAMKFYQRRGWRMIGNNPRDIEMNLLEKTITHPK